MYMYEGYCLLCAVACIFLRDYQEPRADGMPCLISAEQCIVP